ncbi:MAG: NAD-dependent epimerase/dehydratase family protein [Chloroflexota bacterium]
MTHDPILVTGAFGFIGRRLIDRLVSLGQQVIAFDLPGFELPKEWERYVNYVQGDITDSETVKQAVVLAGSIIHLAAVVGDWGEPSIHRAVTVVGTRHLFDAVLGIDSNQRPKIVLASSIVVYGEQLNLGPCDESLPYGMVHGPYSYSKQTQEFLAKDYMRHGLKISIVRLANVYGAGSKVWVDEMCAELLRGSPALIGGGNGYAGLVHVDNVVELLLTVLEQDAAVGEIFNAADVQDVTWRDYCSRLAELVGARSPRSVPRWLAYSIAVVGEDIYRMLATKRRPPLTREAYNLVGSNLDIRMEKAEQMLGYSPIKNFDEGMQEVKVYLEMDKNKL